MEIPGAREGKNDMHPASGVFGIICPLVSIDMKDISRFWIKLSRSASGMPANRDLALPLLSLIIH
jgi:hypothetical protein